MNCSEVSDGRVGPNNLHLDGRFGGGDEDQHDLEARIGSAAVQAMFAPSAAAEQAYVAAMKSDLRNLVTAEEAFFADSVKYTTTVGPGGLNFTVTPGNTPPRIALTADGWTAVIGNVNTRTTCAIFIGSTPMPPATKEGQPACQ